MRKFKFKFSCIALGTVSDMGIKVGYVYAGKGHIDFTGVVNYTINVGGKQTVTCSDDWFYKNFRMLNIK